MQKLSPCGYRTNPNPHCVRAERRACVVFVARCVLLVIIFSTTTVCASAEISTNSPTLELDKVSENHYRGRRILWVSSKIIENNTEGIIKRQLQNESTSTKGTELRTAEQSTPTVKSFTEFDSNCIQPAILDFPYDGLTRLQRQHGWIVIHVLIALYCFWSFAVICEDYFVPAIDQICGSLKLSKDVVGATVMAMATSSPELFLSCIGTFITKGDIGAGTIVGSAVFNMLTIPACCGLFAWQAIALDWRPITRDCLLYLLAVIVVIVTLHDDKIMWYEAIYLLAGYVLYISIMCFSKELACIARAVVAKCCGRNSESTSSHGISEVTPLLMGSSSLSSAHFETDYLQYITPTVENTEKVTIVVDSLENDNSFYSDVNEIPDEICTPWRRHKQHLLTFILRWPITLLLWLTIPNSGQSPNCKYITVVLSVAWIGAISYVVAYAITVIGDTLDIPDSVMGLSVLAAGMSVPEVISSIIVVKQGNGVMGISYIFGSNTFDILLCLGLPWFIKAYFLPTVPGENWVPINSTGILYSTICLLITLIGLYLTFLFNKFVMDWKFGLACSVMYVVFVVFASMIELNIFAPVSLSVCEH